MKDTLTIGNSFVKIVHTQAGQVRRYGPTINKYELTFGREGDTSPIGWTPSQSVVENLAWARFTADLLTPPPILRKDDEREWHRPFISEVRELSKGQWTVEIYREYYD